MSTLRFRCLSFGILLVVGAVLYGFTLPFPFVFDDLFYLVENPLVRDWRSFTFRGDFVAFANYSRNVGLGTDLSTNFILRPFTYLTFYVSSLVGGMNPSWFRLPNIAIHCANAMLVFELIGHLLSVSRKRGALSVASIRFISLTAAVLFLVHPMQIESVTYIVQRFTSLGTFWYLLTLWTHFRARTANGRIAPRAWLGVSVSALALGMLSKEFLFTAPVMAVLLDCVLVGTTLRVACRRALPLLLCLPIIPALLIATTWAQAGGAVSPGSVLRAPGSAAPAGYAYRYAITQPSVILTYVRLLVFPAGLNLDPDFPMSRSLMEWRPLASLVVIGVLVRAALEWYRRETGDLRRSLVLCGVAWFFLALSVDSSVVPLPDVMAEHRAYLPSVGAFMVLACVWDVVRCRFERAGHPAGGVAAVCLVAMALSAVTINRNMLWRTDVSLLEDTVAKSPNKTRPAYNLGAAYLRGNQYPAAEACFRRILTIDPRHVPSYVGLTLIECNRGRYQEAVAIGLAGVRQTPSPYEGQLFQNLGGAYEQLGQLQESIQWFQASAKSRPAFQLAYTALGRVYARLGQYQPAHREFQKAAELGPLDAASRQTALQVEAMLQEGQRGR